MVLLKVLNEIKITVTSGYKNVTKSKKLPQSLGISPFANSNLTLRVSKESSIF